MFDRVHRILDAVRAGGGGGGAAAAEPAAVAAEAQAKHTPQKKPCALGGRNTGKVDSSSACPFTAANGSSQPSGSKWIM